MNKHNLVELLSNSRPNVDVITLFFPTRTIRISYSDEIDTNYPGNDIVINYNTIIDCTTIEYAMVEEKESIVSNQKASNILSETRRIFDELSDEELLKIAESGFERDGC